MFVYIYPGWRNFLWETKKENFKICHLKCTFYFDKGRLFTKYLDINLKFINILLDNNFDNFGRNLIEIL